MNIKEFVPGKYYGKKNKPYCGGSNTITFAKPTATCKYIRILGFLSGGSKKSWKEICKATMPKATKDWFYDWDNLGDDGRPTPTECERKIYSGYNESLRCAMIRADLIDMYGTGNKITYGITPKGYEFWLNYANGNYLRKGR